MRCATNRTKCALSRINPRALLYDVMVGNSPLSCSAGGMSWQKAVEVSQEWVKSNEAGFRLAELHREARRIDFASPHGSFHVTVPEKPGDEWVNRYLQP